MIDIIIFGGQSNMEGQTESCPDPNPVVSGAYEYRYQTDELIPLKHPTGEDLFEGWLESADQGRGSLLPAFCRAYVEESGRDVIAVHAAKGATTVEQWLPGVTPLYDSAKEKILAAFAKADTMDQTVNRILYVWLQGESDAIARVDEELYLQRLITYKNALKRDLCIDRFGIIRVGYFSADHACDEAIMRAQDKAPTVDRDFVMLTDICAEMSLDKTYINPEAHGHYNNLAMEIIGETAGRELAKQIG
ncbi:MAG: hypothetical protein IJY39_13175 [Clostridia bacterium]|nr:hypothetical protein [Clostridia bacterium]